jgi:hypothetical protein
MIVLATSEINVERDSTAGYLLTTFSNQSIGVSGGTVHTVMSADGIPSTWQESYEVRWRNAPADALARVSEATWITINGPGGTAAGGLTRVGDRPHMVGDTLHLSIHAEAR